MTYLTFALVLFALGVAAGRTRCADRVVSRAVAAFRFTRARVRDVLERVR